MGNTQELRFQGLCLINQEGYHHMCLYDEFPRVIRDRLKSSTYNLCAACVRDTAIRDDQGHRRIPMVIHYHSAIYAMEQQLKCEEVTA